MSNKGIGIVVSVLIIAVLIGPTATLMLDPYNAGGFSAISEWIEASYDVYANDTGNETETAMFFDLRTIPSSATILAGTYLCVNNYTELRPTGNVTEICRSTAALSNESLSAAEYKLLADGSNANVTWTVFQNHLCIAINSTWLTSTDIANDGVTLKLKDGTEGTFTLASAEAVFNGNTLRYQGDNATIATFDSSEGGDTPKLRVAYRYSNSLIQALLNVVMGIAVIVFLIVIWRSWDSKR